MPPPVTRSMTRKMQSNATKRESSTNDPLVEPRRKVQRRAKNQDDADVVVDQSQLESKRQKALKDGASSKQRHSAKEEPGYELLIWGDGDMGILGIPVDGADTLCVYPTILPTEKRVQAASAGGMHTVMLMIDGSVQSFGSNDEGALGRKTVGEVWEIDSLEEGMSEQAEPAGVGFRRRVSVQGVCCTDCASFVWTKSGSVYGWGSFRSSRGLIGFSKDVQIQKLPICVYRPANSKKQVVKLASGGGNHVLALLKDGSVLSWGDGEKGQLGRVHPENDDVSKMLQPKEIDSLETSVTDIFCGQNTSFFKTRTGSIFACGLNSSGQLGIQPSPESIRGECMTFESCVESKGLFYEPTEVKALDEVHPEIQDIKSGIRHTLVLTTDGQVYSFGATEYGVLGRSGTENVSPIPERIPAFENDPIESIAAGQDCSLCIDRRGRLWTFGGEHSSLTCVGTGGGDILVPKLLEKEDIELFKFNSIDLGGQHGILLGRQ